MRKLTAKQKHIKNLILDIGADIIGSFIFAVGLIVFIEPAQIAPGGISAVALMINYLWGGPIGFMSFAINIPLLILSYIYLGKRFTFNTIRTLVINTIVIDLIVAPYIPIYQGDRLLGSMYGGLLVGAGLGIIFLRGSTTGGTDIISYLIKRKIPQFSMGRAMMVIDGIIIGASIIVFHDIDAGMFGILSLVSTTRVIDTIIYGMDKGSMVTIISQKNQEIGDQIMEHIGRGVTYYKGEGGFSHQPINILMCAVRKAQFSKLKSIIHEIDPDAFVVVAEADQILGEGFTLEIKE